MNVLTTASRQWATRPDDQRFLNLDSLYESVAKRKAESWTVQVKPKELRPTLVTVDGKPSLRIEVLDYAADQKRIVEPTHWAFGQLSTIAQAPASYLRRLIPELAAVNLSWSLENLSAWDDILVLGQTNGSQVMRASTSLTYGRIWDEQVVKAVQRVAPDGSDWKVPAASYSATNPKRATTLYASDRDVFIFLVNESNPIEVDGEILFRGVMVWNSEVGNASFGMTTFLYRYVCDNRCIWGAQDIKELRIRHTGGAPERFAYEGRGLLEQYANASTTDTVRAIHAAKTFELKGLDREKGGWTQWLQDRGFTKSMAEAGVKAALEEEGDAKSLWDVVQGLTATARGISHTDTRVDLERKAGSLLNIVSKN